MVAPLLGCSVAPVLAWRDGDGGGSNNKRGKCKCKHVSGQAGKHVCKQARMHAVREASRRAGLKASRSADSTSRQACEPKAQRERGRESRQAGRTSEPPAKRSKPDSEPGSERANEPASQPAGQPATQLASQLANQKLRLRRVFGRGALCESLVRDTHLQQCIKFGPRRVLRRSRAKHQKHPPAFPAQRLWRISQAKRQNTLRGMSLGCFRLFMTQPTFVFDPPPIAGWGCCSGFLRSNRDLQARVAGRSHGKAQRLRGNFDSSLPGRLDTAPRRDCGRFVGELRSL